MALLKRPEKLTGKPIARLSELLKLNLKTIKSYLLGGDFQRFWPCKRGFYADRFLEIRVILTLKTKNEPMKKVARRLRRHKPLIMNRLSSKGTFSSGAVENLNLKAKWTMRKAYGFKSLYSIKRTLYHALL